MSQQEALRFNKRRRINRICMASLFFLVIVFAGVASLWVDSWIPGPGRADYSFDLIEDYVFIRSASNRREIGQDDGGIGATLVVERDVTQMGWDDRYIVCYQEPKADTGYSTGWWIIDTQTHSRHGPMESDAYQEMFEQLGISRTIQIHPVESFGRDGVLDEQ